MSQRTAKVESLIRQVVASELPRLLEAKSSLINVTAVDVAPDLRNATVWLGILAKDEAETQKLMTAVQDVRSEIQHELASRMTTKFVSRVHFRLDTGALYAEHINSLLKDI